MRIAVAASIVAPHSEQVTCASDDMMPGGLTTNIGHPKLFMGGEASGANVGPQPTVNNFVAAQTASGLGWPDRFI